MPRRLRPRDPLLPGPASAPSIHPRLKPACASATGGIRRRRFPRGARGSGVALSLVVRIALHPKSKAGGRDNPGRARAPAATTRHGRSSACRVIDATEPRRASAQERTVVPDRGSLERSPRCGVSLVRSPVLSRVIPTPTRGRFSNSQLDAAPFCVVSSSLS